MGPGQGVAGRGKLPRRRSTNLARDRFILGDPDEIIAQLEIRIERLEQNYFIFRAGWPGIESWKVMRSIELMGKHVLPYFHKKYGRG